MNNVYFNKFKNFIPELFFALLFLVTYLPHFLYLWIPYVGWGDSISYLLLAKDFFEGTIPLKNNMMDLPYGLPYFIFIIYKLGGNLNWVILVQTIINLLAFLYLINSLKRFSFKTALLFSIMAWFYVSHSYSMWWNTAILTESLYISFLVILTSLMISYFKTNKTCYIYLILLMILLLCYMRSNGIYLFFIPTFLFLRSVLLKNKHWKHLLFLSFSIVLISSSTNYIVNRKFIPFNTNRFIVIISDLHDYWLNEFNKTKNSKTDKIIDFGYPPPKTQALKLLLNGANSDFPNHYYYRMPLVIKTFNKDSLKEHLTADELGGYFKNNYNNPDDFANFVFKDINPTPQAINKILEVTNIEKRPRLPWLYLNNYLHYTKTIGRNMVFVLSFYLIFFYSIYILFSKNKFLGTFWEIIFYICCIHIISILMLIPSVPSAVTRYAIVSEFTIPLSIALFIFNTQEGFFLMFEIKNIFKKLKIKMHASQ